MGYIESLLAMSIGTALTNHVQKDRLGIILGEAGPLRVLPGQVRIPDTCFVAWDRFPGGKLVDVPIPPVAPDLAVEVLSEGNTEGEIGGNSATISPPARGSCGTSTGGPDRPGSSPPPINARCSARRACSTAATCCPASRSRCGRCSPSWRGRNGNPGGDGAPRSMR